jgi:hypothetical protein
MKLGRPSFAALLGVSIMTCVQSIYQDALGQERYIALARSHWVDPAISLPIAIALLVVSMLCLVAMVVGDLEDRR